MPAVENLQLVVYDVCKIVAWCASVVPDCSDGCLTVSSNWSGSDILLCTNQLSCKGSAKQFGLEHCVLFHTPPVLS